MRYVAITQMEPTDARRMVPCFDEPAMKAQWKITVIYPTGFRAVSNGIEESETPIRFVIIYKLTYNRIIYLETIQIGHKQHLKKR